MGARAKILRTSKGTRQRFFHLPCTHVEKVCALTFSLSVLTRKCAVGHLKEQFSRGESGTPTKNCRDPGSNWGPPDLRSDALPLSYRGAGRADNNIVNFLDEIIAKSHAGRCDTALLLAFKFTQNPCQDLVLVRKESKCKKIFRQLYKKIIPE